MLLDDTLQLLSREPRRKIMYVMEDENDRVFAYEDITEEMIDRDHISEEEEERFRTQMIHIHLPKIEESGLVEHDQRSETIRYVQDKDVEELLDFIQEYEGC